VQEALEITKIEVLELPSNPHGRDARDTSKITIAQSPMTFSTSD